ncbi:MAG TPA: diguanylate cyclase [Verrucomicrobiae bacterium]|nr:diguanylate cyclase [Verrucomicrobiae bacterium]
MLYLLRPYPLNWKGDEHKRLEVFVDRLAKVEPYFEAHVQRACFYALNFGRYIGLSDDEMRLLYLATFFHDAGKISIPDAILQKPGPLTPEEFEVMKTHPVLSAEICLKLGPLEEIAPLVAAHHEKLDGSGYPRRLKDKDIPFLARIVATIEIYDALRNERSYKPPFSLEKSVEILRQEAAEGRLDRNVVEAFIKFGESQYIDPQILAVDFFREPEKSTAASDAPANQPTEAPAPPAAPAGEEKLTVLIAEDNPDQMEILQTMLGQGRYRLVCAMDGEEAWAKLNSEPVDIALLDIMMPKITGLEVCRRIREDDKLKNIYVIFLTAMVSGEDRVKGLELGGNDYMTKPYYVPELMARLSVGERLTRQRREIEKQAAHDALTGLHNRRLFEERLNHEFERARRYGRPLSVLMVDVDDFKKINDQHGHHCGDAVLKGIAAAIGDKTRKSDISARYGGEEFIVLLPEIPLEGGVQAAEKLRQAIASLQFAADSGVLFCATVSIGVASTSARRYNDGYSVVKDADFALYKAKGLGKNRIEYSGD